MRPVSLFLFIIACSYNAANAQQTIQFASGEQQTTLLELYTSEGCYSCPPADRWLTQLKKHPQLWQQLVPLAFHVDYWNYLGWEDRFSSAAYSNRQRRYAQVNAARTVYTPGFFSNGREWRGWFSKDDLGKLLGNNSGKLSASIEGQKLSANYTPPQSIKQELQLNIALLGFNRETEVTDGENEGKTLHHDFVVLYLDSQDLEKSQQGWQLQDYTLNIKKHNAGAIAIWVSTTGSPLPLQATGSWLP